MASKIFPKNVHQVERVLRVLAGIGLLSLTVIGPQTRGATSASSQSSPG